MQTFRPPAPSLTPLPVVDLQGLPAEARDEAARRLARAELGRPFDLARGPLLRATLLRLEPQRHAGLLTMHHIASDGWSQGVLVRELAALYRAAQGSGHEAAAALPPLPIQYADFAAWQRRWLRGEVLAAELGYWRQRLEGAPELLELPTDRPRQSVTTPPPSALAHLLVDEALGRQLHALARRLGATPFMVLLGTFQLLLSRHSGQRDICTGTPIAGRNRVELEDLIGFFVNTLVLRTDLAGDPTFEQLLAQVRHHTLDAHEHQDLPFDKLVEELHPRRSLQRTPLFQVLLVVQNAPERALELPGLQLEPLALASGTGQAKFDLTLSFTEAGDELFGALEYNAALFDATTARRLLRHLHTLLAAAAEHPSDPISTLPLLTLPERHALLHEAQAEPLQAKEVASLTGSEDAALIAPLADDEEIGPLEAVLLELWRRGLGVEKVGLHDDFFDLGGHSVLAMWMIAHLEDGFGIVVPLVSLFETPTVAGLAATLRQLEPEPGAVEEIARELLISLSEEPESAHEDP